ncbi:MAG: xanthine dehydrogenase accessory factor [Maribacter sp.]|jgi:xanthine dehydrogenase accessory factor
MKEINNIVQYFKSLDAGVECALATVVYVDGSSYRRVGARMLVAANGQWEGGISGGCLEGDALRKAQMVIHSKKSKIVTYDTREDDSSAIGIGLGCNGLIDVLIAPINRGNPDHSIHVLENCIENRAEHILITIIEDKNDKEIEGQIFTLEKLLKNIDLKNKEREILLENIQEVQSKQRSKIIHLNEIKILIEYLAPPIHLLVFGGQYDTLPLLQLKEFLAWKATLICKSQNTNPKALSLADKILNQREYFKFPVIDAYTIAILMSHDYQTDKDNLNRILKETNIQYIGMLGPKKRGEKILKELEVKESDFSRIFSPVGLDTGATTPEEISISIVAEIRAFFSQRKGESLKFRQGDIHGR